MIAKNIVNMIKCRAGEHCLFRTFGLGGVVDSPNRITRNALQTEINKWFPGISVQSVDVKRAGSDGNFDYGVKIYGGENG